MKKNIFLLLAALFTANVAFSQDADTLSNRDGVKVEHSIKMGLGIGASSPIPIPNRISEMSWTPHLGGLLGYRLHYLLNPKMSLKTGLQLQHQGMSAEAKVYQMFTQANVEDAEVSGYFTGYNETKINATYLAVPLLISYSPSQKWNFDAGMFVAIKIQGHFSGAVKDGYIRIGEPTGDRVEVGYETFDFSDQVNPLSYGLLFAAERKINDHWSAWFDLSWALNSAMKSSFTGLEYKMYNIYGFLGASYKL